MCLIYEEGVFVIGELRSRPNGRVSLFFVFGGKISLDIVEGFGISEGIGDIKTPRGRFLFADDTCASPENENKKKNEVVIMKVYKGIKECFMKYSQPSSR